MEAKLALRIEGAMMASAARPLRSNPAKAWAAGAFRVDFAIVV
jgi:hypothetical protein